MPDLNWNDKVYCSFEQKAEALRERFYLLVTSIVVPTVFSGIDLVMRTLVRENICTAHGDAWYLYVSK